MSLHIGVGSLDKAHYGTSGKLYGAENDATAMAVLASDRGFTDRTVLLGKAASTQNVVSWFGRARTSLATGGTMFITYSGHGSQLQDTSGDESTDYRDEGWCLHDRMLIDDEVGVLLATLDAGVKVFVIVDSCHSGTILQALPAPKTAWLEGIARTWSRITEGRPKRLKADEMKYAYKNHRQVYDDARAALAGKSSVVIANVLQLSACQDWQETPDGKPNSFFTAKLIEELQQNGSKHSAASLAGALTKASKKRQPALRNDIGAADPALETAVPFPRVMP